jgi:hypothetical protein
MKKKILFHILFHLAIGVLAVAALGCRRRVRVTVPQANVTVGQPQQPAASVGVRIGGTYVTAVQQACNPNQPEACNGLDDNCNGVIDEGCGFSSGHIQITLAWATGADLDLYVTDPQGYVISYSNPRSPSGGHLDHDARGACVRSQSGATIENVYWETSQPPRGPYQIEIHYWGNCRVAGVTQATLSIAVGGQIIGAYNVVLNDGERQAVAAFNMP